MFKFLIGSEAGTPANFSVTFSCGEVSLTKHKQLFAVSPSHITAPPTTAFSNKIPFIKPAPISFLIPSFVRASIATVVNFQGLIEVVPVNTPLFEHDPVTLTLKGLLIEEARTKISTYSNTLTNATEVLNTVTITNSTDFSLFASGGVF
jgi:hypothetical protein